MSDGNGVECIELQRSTSWGAVDGTVCFDDIEEEGEREEVLFCFWAIFLRNGFQNLPPPSLHTKCVRVKKKL